MISAKKRFILAVTLAEPGGVQSFVLTLATYLKKAGHEVLVVAGDGTWLFQKLQLAGIPSIRLKHLGRSLHPWRDLRALFELIRILKQLRSDAIYLNSSKMGALGSIAARLAHIPRVVYRIGGWVFLEPLSPLVRFTYRLIERLTAPLKDTIICVHPKDEAIARALKFHPRQRILTIPNGVDIEAINQTFISRDEARKLLNLPADTFIFGTIAHLYPAKDLPRYLEACNMVHAQEPDASFVILGEGPERKQIEDVRRKLKLENSVFLPGARDDAASLINAFDAFVLPSAKEGMPWSLLEAMAASLPCIATDVGANAWMLEQGAGSIVPKQHPRELARAMLHAMHHPSEATQQGQRARMAVTTRFSLQTTLEENTKTLVD